MAMNQRRSLRPLMLGLALAMFAVAFGLVVYSGATGAQLLPVSVAFFASASMLMILVNKQKK